jgi:hypothetical protein
MTRAASNIGWIKYPIAMCLFSCFSALLASPILSDSMPTLEHKFTRPIPYKIIFETPVWDIKGSMRPETFCIFRNYASGTGLQDLNIAHYQGRLRWDFETKGAREWSDCRLMSHYKLQLKKELGISIGLGVSASRLLETYASSSTTAIGPQFLRLHGFAPITQISGQWTNSTAGDFIGSLRTSLSPLNSGNGFRTMLLGPSDSKTSTNAAYVWNESQLIWLPKVKKGSGRPYLLACSNPAQNYMEAGFIYSGSIFPNTFKTYTVILGLRTSETPASLQIIKYWKSWSGGIKVYWHQQLGWQSAMQIKKSW